MDIIKKILSYDRRFIIRKGSIITIDVLDVKKFKNINKLLFNNLLQRKPKPLMKYSENIEMNRWVLYQLKLGNSFAIWNKLEIYILL